MGKIAKMPSADVIILTENADFVNLRFKKVEVWGREYII
jgi:hypothetical protein